MAIAIRQSVPEDAAFYSEMVIESSPMFPVAFGGRIGGALQAMFAEPKNLFSGDHVIVAETDGGERAGMLLGYTAAQKRREDLFTGYLLLRELGADMLVRLPRLISLSRFAGIVHDGEFFVSNIAIDSSFRGQGAGKALMLRAEEIAAGLGATKMSLEVECDNPAAYGLYSRLGYENTKRLDFTVAGKSKSIYRMVKKIG